ncbi:hypothetical protein SLA2020_462170 [Shorea laevis]
MATASTAHVRSVSLPFEIHPLFLCVEEQLQRLRASKVKLSGLRELYERIDDLIHLPQTQQTLSKKRCEVVEDVLDGSVRLLDVCGATREVFSQMKQSVQELESSLRRRNGGESTEIGAYLVFRKELNKVITQGLRSLHRMEKKSPEAVSCSDMLDVVGMITDAEKISLSIFESLLSVLSYRKHVSRCGGWSVVPKMMLSKFHEAEPNDASEVQKMDAELLVLKSSKDIKLVQVQKVLRGLKALELSIQKTEEELESVFRRLLKTRVSLLNILITTNPLRFQSNFVLYSCT